MNYFYLVLFVFFWATSVIHTQSIGDLRSNTSSGNWGTASSWQLWDGTVWKSALLSDIPTSSTTKAITVRAGHTINLELGGKFAYDLIIEAGASITENPIGSSGKALTICHNLICNGNLGNGTTMGRIVLNFQGNCSISGTGNINCNQIRSSIGFTTNTNLNISANVNLRAAGIELYNNSTNRLFNIYIAPGCTLNCAGDGIYSGDLNLDSSPGSTAEYGGSLTVDGTLIISGIFYASSNNTTNACSYIINHGGSISCKEIVLGASGTAGTIFNLNSGGAFTIKGADGSTTFSAVNNTINLNGSFEYAYLGAQTIRALNYSSLKLSGSGNKTLEAGKAASIKENGTLQLNGGNLVLGTGTLSISSNGTTLGYSAPGAHNTGVEWNYPFANLVLNKTGTITINSNKVFNGNLYLVSGNVILSNYDIQGVSINGGSSSSYFIENGTGKLKLYVTGSTLFPVGESISSYNPILLNNNGGEADYYSVRCTTSTEGTVNNTGVVNKQWTVTEDISGGSNLMLSFQWNASDEIAPFNRLSAMIGIRADSFFDLLPSQPVEGADPFIIRTTYPYILDMSAGKTFTVGIPSLLPVELQSFNYTLDDKKVKLEWLTITERNNLGFEIERKKSQGIWMKAGFVHSSGFSNVPRQYYWSEILNSGTYLYRLKIIDTDGCYQYSDSITICITSPSSFMLYQNHPNPFNPSTTIKYAVPEGVHRVKLSVYDVMGRETDVLLDEDKEEGVYEINYLPKWSASGVYFCRLVSSPHMIVKKLLLLK